MNFGLINSYFTFNNIEFRIDFQFLMNLKIEEKYEYY